MPIPSKIDQFFGLNLKAEQFDIDAFADLIGCRRVLEKDKYVKRLMKANGRKHLIVSIVKRQVLLKLLKPLLRQNICPPDPDFHTKEVNTATDKDRRYGAEEKLLWFCLCIATGKTFKQLERIQFRPDADAMRRIPGAKDGKFDRLWELLAEQNGDYILKFKNGEVGVNPDAETTSEKKGFWSKMFS